MKRISNLFAIVRSVFVSFWAMLRWLSEDKTTAQLAEAFERAGKIMARVLQFYSESSATIQKGARIITTAADQLSELSPEMQKVAESYISDLDSLTKKAKPAQRQKRKYTWKQPATITITTITKPGRRASASSPICTPADCKLCDKADCPTRN